MDYAFIAMVLIAAFGGYFFGTECARLRRELSRAKARIRKLEEMAYIDELTRLGNRRYFDEHLVGLAAHVLRAGEPLAIVAVDLDDLKVVNDGRGHPVGDRLLGSLADVLRSSIRPTDHACRVGGDEFYVLLPACSEPGLVAVIERMRKNLQVARLVDGDVVIPVRASVGGAIFTLRGDRAYVADLDVGNVTDRSTLANAARVLVEVADRSLYDAKAKKGERGSLILPR